MTKILIIDDDKNICGMLMEMISEMGFFSEYTNSINEGLEANSKNNFDIIFLDVFMPDGNGLEAIPKLKQNLSSPEIIIITGKGDESGAELAVNYGAWDYIEKPFSIQELKLSLKRVVFFREQKSQNKSVLKFKRGGIIGKSERLKNCLDQSANAAQSDANVLITGETGTGKELFARAIHMNSHRSKRDFVVVDCASLPDSIVESILFGHVKGSFTGADQTRDGLIGFANGGTLFLDEIGELPLQIQKKFLRVIQERSYRPLGAKKEIKSDFRLIAATHRNLHALIKSKNFREDLLFRIQAITIEPPPLKMYIDDVHDIIKYHANRICKLYGIKEKKFSGDFMESVSIYNWPGNIRELVNTIEKVIADTFNETTIFSTHLPLHIRTYVTKKKIKKSKKYSLTTNILNNQDPPKFKNFLNDMKSKYIKDIMDYVKWDINKGCELSGLSKAHLYRLLNEYNIKNTS